MRRTPEQVFAGSRGSSRSYRAFDPNVSGGEPPHDLSRALPVHGEAHEFASWAVDRRTPRPENLVHLAVALERRGSRLHEIAEEMRRVIDAS